MYLVNDGSKSGISPEDIRLLSDKISGFTYIDSPVNQGKGGALRDAVRQTTGKWVIYTDADYPYLISNAVEMFRLLSTDSADVVGSRLAISAGSRAACCRHGCERVGP